MRELAKFLDDEHAAPTEYVAFAHDGKAPPLDHQHPEAPGACGKPASALSKIADEQADSPDFQNFLALNIFVIGRQERGRHRVTITTSMRQMAAELSLVLPTPVRRAFRSHDQQISYKGLRREIPERDARRDPLVAICSCGKPQCEHIEIACRHFGMVQAFADNTAQILEEIHAGERRFHEAYQAHSVATDRLHQLNQELGILTSKLASAQAASERTTSLEQELDAKGAEILELQFQIEEYSHTQNKLQAEIAVHEQNYRDIALEVSRQSGVRTAAMRLDNEIDPPALAVLGESFLPTASDVPPERKSQRNTRSDHHMAPTAHLVAARATRLNFVREVGIDRRIAAKTGKVHVLPAVGELELVVPRDGDANIIRVYTTARTIPQHYFAAYLLAREFDVEVQLS